MKSNIIDKFSNCSRCGATIEIEEELIENNKLYIWTYCPNSACEERRLTVKELDDKKEVKE